MSRSANLRIWAFASLLTGMTGGCSDIYFDRREALSFHAGDAVASNIAVQAIDPWPRDAGNRDLPSNGQRMQRAVERYRNNKTTPLATTGTSSVQYAPVLAPTNGATASPSQ